MFEHYSIKGVKDPVKVYIDAEWQDIVKREIVDNSLKRIKAKLDICLQVQVLGVTWLIWNQEALRRLSPVERRRLDRLTSELKVKTMTRTFTPELNLIELVLEEMGVPKSQSVEVVLFYSPRDLELAFGSSNIEGVYKRGSVNGYIDVIYQKRCIKGHFKLGGRAYKLRDRKGWVAQGGLKELAESCGVRMTNKGEMDIYKSRMFEGLKEEMSHFLKYAVDDVVKLEEIDEAFPKLVRKVCGLWGVELGEVKDTTGSIVAAAFESFIMNLHPDMPLVLRKLGRLDTSVKKYHENVNLHTKVLYSRANAKPEDITKLLTKVRYKTLGISEASINALAERSGSAPYAALVQGGRCYNEQPWSYAVDYAADIDLKSCYGSALAKFYYPIGLPTVVAHSENEEAMTLGQCFDLYKDELVDGLYTMTVSGELPFRQDLVFSKVVDLGDIKRAAGSSWDKDFQYDDRDDDLAHIPGIFCLPRMEVRNGVITADIWNAIEKVSTNVELKAWRSLRVDALVFYPKSKEASSLHDFCQSVMNDDGTLTFAKGHTVDTRTTVWYKQPIGDFIKPLLDARGAVKGLGAGKNVEKGKAVFEKLMGKPFVEGDEGGIKAVDKALKLFVNTLYGVLASPYFAVGNAVVANNITARARLGTWMMAKSLRLVQSITDGGVYNPFDVNYILPKDESKSQSWNRLPGFDKLANIRNWGEGRVKGRAVRGSAPGFTKDMFEVQSDLDKKQSRSTAEKLGNFFDKLALDHVSSFWGNYGLELPFDIEHKGENTAIRAAYWGKGHYAQKLTLPGCHGGVTIRFKIRGAKQDIKDPDGYKYPEHPAFELLENILDGKDDFPADTEYAHFELLKISKWLQSKSLDASVRPGDDVVTMRNARFNNTHMHCDTVDEYLKRYNRKTHHRGKPVELFEKYSDSGIPGVHQRMLSDTL